MKCILIKKKECKKSIKVPHVSFSEVDSWQPDLSDG